MFARAASLPSLDSTFGCLFLAGILSTALWGVGCLQLYYYYERFAKTDKRWLTIYIFLVWVLDTVLQAILVQSLYTYFVKEYGNWLYLAQPQKILLFVALITGIVNAMVQSIFVMRAWHLSDKNIALTCFLSVAVLAQLALNVAYFGQMYKLTQFTQLLGLLTTERALNIVVLCTDTLIAVVLIYLLRRLRSRMEKTDTVVTRLVIYAISTGLITSLWAVVALIGSTVRPSSFIYVLVDIVFPKLYFNCMLASLNDRSNHRKQLQGEEIDASMRFNTHVSGLDAADIEPDLEGQRKLDSTNSRTDSSTSSPV